MQLIKTGFLAALLLAGAPFAAAQEGAVNQEAEKLWQEVIDSNRPPDPPEDWTGTPTLEQQEAFKKVLAEKSGEAADKARDFYTRYPDHPKAQEAREREKLMLSRAIQFGAIERLAQLEASPALTEEEKFEAEINQLNRRAMEKQSEGMDAVLAEFEKGTRELMARHPDRPEGWQLLFLIGKNAPGEKGMAVLKEILEGESPEEVREAARAEMKKRDAIGHPVDIAFTSADGKQIDLRKMQGQVVLVDFWAAWCGPCIQELPNVKRVYDKYHDQGFEIVGISFDRTRDAMDKVVKEFDMTWPQYFDGEGWGNKFGAQFNITAIPTMWLLDKKGLLRDLNARADLEEKVKELLAE